MKKRFWLIVTVAVIILIIAFSYTQRNNIKGFFYSFKFSGDEIETMISDNDSMLKEQVESFLGHSIRSFTDEETNQIKDGTITEDEVVEKIIAEELEKSISSATENSGNKVTEQGTTKTDGTDTSSSNTPAQSMEVSRYITELYNLKNEYIGKLDQMVESAARDFRNLPSKEKTYSKQLQIGASYMNKAMALESECDEKVSSIVKSLEKQLKSEGKSTEIISVINKAYNSEKTLKRAHYLNMFK